MRAFGILGGLFFAYAGVPAAWRTVRAGKHLGTPVDIAAAIVFGSITMYTYLFLLAGFDWVLTLNYAVETISWSVLLFYGLAALAAE